MFAGNNKLSNLTGDHGSQQYPDRRHDREGHAARTLREKYEAFNWHVLEVDGHNMREFVAAIDEAKAIYEKPTVIIAHTIPGKGIKEIEFDYPTGTASRRPNRRGERFSSRAAHTARQDRERAYQLICMISDSKIAREYSSKPEQEPTRDGFGRGAVGSWERKIRMSSSLCADLAESTRMLAV